MSELQEIKLVLIEFTGLSKDALHIYVGLSVLLISAVALRRPLHSRVPWFAVLAAAVVLEVADMRDDLISLGYWRWAASLHDLVNTLFWPTVLRLLTRRGNLGLARPD